jgi:DNA-binding transcriptional ArsR family regulator
MLERYWREAFEEEWARLEPELAAGVSEAGHQIEQRGLYGMLRGLWPEVRSDPQAERFWLERPHDHEVAIGPDDTLVLAPSAYVWPHVRVNCDGPWPLGLVFPLSSIVREARPRIPPTRLVGTLRALADDTRLRALRLLAERPRSTQELAPLVGVSEAGHLIEQRGLYGMLRGLWPEVRSDPRTERFWLERPHEHEVAIGPDDTLVLAPSAYVWPHVRVNCDGPWPLGLVFPVSSIVREARPRIPPARLVGTLRALADDTRLRALRLLAERPRSTQELAPLVGVSEAALSKHLRVLADAGLLERRREGYYVLYRLAPGQVAGLTPSLESFLHGDGEATESD